MSGYTRNAISLTIKMKNGFTLVEVIIAIAIVAIFGSIVVNIANGNSIVPSKQACIDAGGKWSEGIQYGSITQLCTYN
jgi:prepilin-type N-terminal cleavage/methylation domain-containing protein